MAKRFACKRGLFLCISYGLTAVKDETWLDLPFILWDMVGSWLCDAMSLFFAVCHAAGTTRELFDSISKLLSMLECLFQIFPAHFNPGLQGSLAQSEEYTIRLSSQMPTLGLCCWDWRESERMPILPPREQFVSLELSITLNRTDHRMVGKLVGKSESLIWKQ